LTLHEGQPQELKMATLLTQGTLFLSGAFLLFLLLLIFLYNGLVQARARTLEAWGGIQVQLKRRADLVPNLVAAVKGYAAHERQVLDEVAQTRAEAAAALGPAAAGRTHQALNAALGRLLAVAEHYPDLKASDNFLELQQELADVEEKIAYARRFYNQKAQEYNIRIQSVPALMVAWLCRFKPAEYFQAEATDRQTIQVGSRP
jgi:LemA protein